MGRFRIKDLMVNVVAAEDLKLDVKHYLCLRVGPPTRIIDWESICHRVHTTEIFEIPQECTAGSMLPLTPLTEEVYEHFWEIDPVEMAAVREQYRVAIEQIDLAEQRSAEQLTPKTVEEVEVLENQFTEALKELAVLKKGMKKG